MRLTQLKEHYFSILISASDLSEIVDFIRLKYADINISASCNDGTTIETKSIDDIISFENASFRTIESLTIKASTTSEDLIRLGFSSRRRETSEIYIVSDSDEHGRYVYQEIFQRVRSMKPWYDLIAQTPAFIWILIPLIIFNIYYADRALSEPMSPNSYFTLLVLFAILLLTLSYTIERFKRYLFPKVFFLIGKQIVVMDKIKSLRNFIFVTVFVSIVTGVIVNLIS